MSGDDVTETRQETAAEYLRAAAETLRDEADDRIDDLFDSLANWLGAVALQEAAGRGGAMVHYALDVAADVLGRTWGS